MPRLNSIKIFTFDKIMNRFWINFTENTYITVIFRGKLLHLIGQELTKGTPQQASIYGKNKGREF